MISKKIEVAFVLFSVGIIAWLVYLNFQIIEKGRVERLVQEHNTKATLQEQLPRQVQKREDVIIEKIAQGIKNQVRCTINDCLTSGTLENPDQPYGTAVITGYYTASMQDSNDKKVVCNAIVVSGGPGMLSAYIDKYADIHKNLSKGKDGEREISVDLDRLSDTEKNMLLHSSKDEPVEMFILQSRDSVSSSNSCYTSTAVIDVREPLVEPAIGVMGEGY